MLLLNEIFQKKICAYYQIPDQKGNMSRRIGPIHLRIIESSHLSKLGINMKFGPRDCKIFANHCLKLYCGVKFSISMSVSLQPESGGG